MNPSKALAIRLRFAAFAARPSLSFRFLAQNHKMPKNDNRITVPPIPKRKGCNSKQPLAMATMIARSTARVWHKCKSPNRVIEALD